MQMTTHVQTSVQSIKIKTNVFANMLLVEKGCSNPAMANPAALEAL
jgi:hypothetical protein